MSEGQNAKAGGARMLPTAPTSDETAESERLVFRRLKEDCPPEWTFIHSLGVARHASKLWAEMDFVAITPRGVLVIEVKGGAVARRDGAWYSGDHRLKEAPLKQASDAAAALRRDLHEKGLGRRAPIDGAALLTDVTFDVEGTDIDANRIGDVRAMGGSLADWIDQTLEYCRKEAESRQHRELPGLSEADRQAIVEALAGDFELVPTAGNKITEARGEMIRFTDEQKEALELAEDNPRTFFDGGAGTGKTLLALEHARSRATAGERVLLVVYNKSLALELRESTREVDGLDVFHFHGLADHLIEAGGLPQPQMEEDVDYFRETLPRTAIEALGEIEEFDFYDLVLVDESQDVLYETALDLFDCVLKGGLANGRWCFFHDSKQNIYDGETPEAIARLDAVHPARKVLRINCRNTKQIAVATAACSGREPERTLPVDGPEVQTLHFQEDRDLVPLIGRTLNRWLKEDEIAPEQIVILSKKTREKTQLAGGLPPGVSAPMKDIAKEDPSEDDGAIRFSTIHSFKGLEAEAVLLLTVGNLADESNRDLLYVAMSRARLELAIGVPEGQRGVFEGLA